MKIDKNGKLFGKINLIDFFVVIAIIAAMVGISFRFVTTAAKNVKEKAHFSYVVEVEGIRMFTVDALNKKGTVTNIKDESIIGEITDVKYEQSETQAISADGKTVFVKIPERYTALITVEAEGNEGKDSYFVGNNIELSVGSTISMTTKYVNSTGKVVSIEKLD